MIYLICLSKYSKFDACCLFCLLCGGFCYKKNIIVKKEEMGVFLGSQYWKKKICLQETFCIITIMKILLLL